MKQLADELILFWRIAYSLGAALAVGWASGLTYWEFFVYDAIGVCVNSIVFQYIVVHWVLAQIAHTKGRALFLLLWIISTGVASSVGLLLFGDVDWTASLEEVTSQIVYYRYVYIVAVSFFIAGAMARRAFAKHGGLA